MKFYDRTKSQFIGQGTWHLANHDYSWHQNGREDYSIVLNTELPQHCKGRHIDEEIPEDFLTYLINEFPCIRLCKTGTYMRGQILFRTTNRKDNQRISYRGSNIQARIFGQGQIRIKQIELDALKGDTSLRSHGIR